jgi:hypothetical protein
VGKIDSSQPTKKRRLVMKRIVVGVCAPFLLAVFSANVGAQGKKNTDFPWAQNSSGVKAVVNESEVPGGSVDGVAWTTNSPIPVTGGLAQTTVVADDSGRVYSIGGGTGTGPDSRINQLWSYDPGSDTYTQLADLPITPGAAHYGSAVQMGGFIYVFGGVVGPPGTVEVSNRTLIYDIANDVWMNGANMPDVRFGSAVCAVNGRIFVAGGGSAVIETSLWEYDVANDAFITAGLAPLPDGLPTYRIHAVGLDASNSCHVFAGAFDGALNLRYDVDANTWTFRQPMPVGVTDPGAVTDGTLIYVTGGPAGVNGRLQIYDPDANTWSMGPNMPSPVNNTGAALTGGTIYNLGGFDGTTSVPFNYSVTVGGTLRQQ